MLLLCVCYYSRLNAPPSPFSINAVPHVCAEAKAALLARGATIDPSSEELIDCAGAHRHQA